MQMPTLEDIFYNMNIGEISSPELEDSEQSLRRSLEIMLERKKIKSSAAKRIIEIEEEVCRSAKCAGFVCGAAFAVRLLCFRD